jgi:nucleoside-diphosphate-sugar epimerase
MKILVTGATGKVGSRLAKRLAQRGDRVRALVRDPKRAVDLSEAGIELVQGDLLDADSLAAAVRGVDAVVHCAAFFRGATAEQAHAVNDLGSKRLARAAREASVKRFLFTSTDRDENASAARRRIFWLWWLSEAASPTRFGRDCPWGLTDRSASRRPRGSPPWKTGSSLEGFTH